jgi:transcriptional regulator with XRE-family HTH domain
MAKVSPNPLQVAQWTGVECRALRLARRLSTREFAEQLGISDRIVSKWEVGGRSAIPRPFSQQILDIALERSSEVERERFVQLRREPPKASVPRAEPAPKPPPVKKEPPAVIVQRTLLQDDMRDALAKRDMATVYLILSKHGVSQRQIAAMTEQSQSEISEILAGRRVLAYPVLERIADGLRVPRGLMGLAYSDPRRRNRARRSSAAAAARALLARRRALGHWVTTGGQPINS